MAARRDIVLQVFLFAVFSLMSFQSVEIDYVYHECKRTLFNGMCMIANELSEIDALIKTATAKPLQLPKLYGL